MCRRRETEATDMISGAYAGWPGVVAPPAHRFPPTVSRRRAFSPVSLRQPWTHRHGARRRGRYFLAGQRSAGIDAQQERFDGRP
jgi:hypothetical protein